MPLTKPRPAAPAVARWLQPSDLPVLVKLPFAAALAWFLPARCWDGLAMGAARLQRGERQRLAARLTSVLGASPPVPVDRLALRHLALLRLDQLAYLRCHLPGGWYPELAVEGLAHLRAALAAGRGAILWMTPTLFAPLIGKRSLCEAGFPPHHLSHPDHGFSSRSRIGRRLLNPLRTRIEDRYLAERVMLGDQNQAHAALRRVGGLLRRNAVVSISAGRHGSRVAAAPWLGARLEIASGAPGLAIRLGSALLPVTVRRTESGGFVTRIWPPVVTGPGTTLESVAAALAAVLSAFAAEHPEQIHWNHNCLAVPPWVGPA